MFGMNKRKGDLSVNEKLEEERDSLKARIDELKKEVRASKEELAEVKHKKKMEEENIKHMVKIKEEKLEIEYQKKVQTVEAQKAIEVAQVKDTYRDKMEVELNKQVDNMKEMYKEVLERLPNINAKLKGDI